MPLTCLLVRPAKQYKAGGIIVIQMLAPVQKTAKALIASTVNLKVILNQNLHSPPYTSLDLDLNLELNSNLDYLNLYLDPNIKPDMELDIEPNMDDKLNINKHPDLELNLKDLGLNSKAKKILKDIAKLRDKRLVKPNYTPYTKKL